MPKVIHLLPYDGIGGAEEAARSMRNAQPASFEFHLRFIFPNVRSQSERRATFNPIPFAFTAYQIVSEAPDLLILSLWRSCLIGILVKLLRPRTRLVVLIHNSLDAHIADRLVTRLAMRMSAEIWADSDASMRERFRRPPRAPLTIIPFLTRHVASFPRAANDSRASRGFIYWGRLAAQKNLIRALDLFHLIYREVPDARFTIIGPDSGELSELRSHCRELGLGAEAVIFAGPKDFPRIREMAADHAFYLQTSRYEGMAMSVIEAMQLGLVPVVTPVGEIGTYCRHNHNSVLVNTDEQAAADAVKLVRQPEARAKLQRQAIATWADHPLYRDVVVTECARLVVPKG